MKASTLTVTNLLRKMLTRGKTAVAPQQNIPDLESFIYQRLTSKKFRKTKMDVACSERTHHAIHTRFSQHQPLKVVFPQGGYKLWRFPTSPESDWAEFFNIAYLIEYLLPIANTYSPGVELVYYMHTLLMELHDNLTTEEIQAYVNSFQRLINEFQKYLPENFRVSILKDADLYSRQEYFAKLEAGKKLAAEQYLTWPDSKKQDFRRMAQLNIKWNGKEDWQKLSEKNREEKLYLAALYETAASSNLERVAEIVKSPDNVLVFTKATKDFIGIGSSKNSVAKYWVGYGVLETNANGDLMPRILTPSQYAEIQKLSHQKVEVKLIAGRNFKSILVFHQSL